MNGDALERERAYWARDVAKELGVSESTLRKYCLILERQGYRFARGDHGRRAFLSRDFAVLKELRELSQTYGMTLEYAAAEVMSLLKDDVTTITPADTKKSMPKEEDATPITLADMNRTISDGHIQAVLKANEALQGELQSLKKQVASTHQKLDAISRHVDIVITETRAERHRKDKKWWRFWE